MKYLRKNKIIFIYAVAVLLLLLSVFLGLMLGASDIDIFSALKSICNGELDNTDARILCYVRLPRVLGAILCGAGLAVAGVIIQTVLMNSLASPSIIGVNSGAGLAVTVCAALGIYGGIQTAVFSFVGAFAAVMLVSLFAKRYRSSSTTVILVGVALNALLGAISDAIITADPDTAVMSNDFKMGDLSTVTLNMLIPTSVIIIASVVVTFSLANVLEVLTLGDENAKGIGLNASVMRVALLIPAALLAGASVSIAGLLSFVGLLVPHIVRRLCPMRCKHLITLSALFGAGFVTLCDTVSRVIFAPYELPVGIFIAFLGAPFFVFILIKGKGGRSFDRN